MGKVKSQKLPKYNEARLSERKGGLKITFYDINKKVVGKKNLSLITKAEAKKNNYDQLSQARGIDLCNACSLATAGIKKFSYRVVAYSVKILPEELTFSIKNFGLKIEVTFWEEKKKK